jgi:hypothetical protein
VFVKETASSIPRGMLGYCAYAALNSAWYGFGIGLLPARNVSANKIAKKERESFFIVRSTPYGGVCFPAKVNHSAFPPIINPTRITGFW